MFPTRDRQTLSREPEGYRVEFEGNGSICSRRIIEKYKKRRARRRTDPQRFSACSLVLALLSWAAEPGRGGGGVGRGLQPPPLFPANAM